MNENRLLEVQDLCLRFRVEQGQGHPVDGVSLSVDRGQTLGVVGESGCGKTVAALAILRLVPSPPGEVTAGRVLFRGEDLLQASPSRMEEIRGARIAMIFQEPMTSLNPVYSCGEQIAEVLRHHQKMPRSAAWARAVELLQRVRIPDAPARAKEYPHQISGGMRQRVMIAMAIACDPDLLIADEPTTALDVTVQSQILDVLEELQSNLGMGVIHITHDLAVIAETAHHIAVMYAGKVVEEAPVAQLFESPAHPYTLGLLACRPELGQRKPRLTAIPGRVPDLWSMPRGCRFQQRCPFAVDRCTQEEPPLEDVASGQRAACWEWKRVQAAGRWPGEHVVG